MSWEGGPWDYVIKWICPYKILYEERANKPFCTYPICYDTWHITTKDTYYPVKRSKWESQPFYNCVCKEKATNCTLFLENLLNTNSRFIPLL